jgi:hypothetical protein
MKTPRFLVFVLLGLELLFLAATVPGSMPNNPKINALFNEYVRHPTAENKASFNAAMDRAREPDKRRQRIAVYLFVVNGIALCLIYWKVKQLEKTPS